MSTANTSGRSTASSTRGAEPVSRLTLTIGSGDPGREIEGPMAIVILGGLRTSTLLSLLVLPTLALRYGRFGREPSAVSLQPSAVSSAGPSSDG